MKNAMLKNAFAEIRKTKSRFFSIFGIIAIGTGFFAGLMATEPDMKLSADHYFDRTNLMNYRVVSTYGFNKEDIEELDKIEGLDIYPGYFADMYVNTEEGDKVARIYSLDNPGKDNEYNNLTLVEGRFPENEHECIVDGGKLVSGFDIGDKITLKSPSDTDMEDTLSVSEYTIVGRYNTPMFISDTEKGNTTIGNGSVYMMMYIPTENFTTEYYTQVFVRAESLDGYNCYRDEYKEKSEEIKEKLEEAAEKRKDGRLQQIKDEAETDLADAEKEFKEGKEEAEKQISENEEKLKEAKTQLDDAKVQLEDAKKQIDEGQAQSDEAKKQLDEAKAQIDAGKELIESNEKTLTDTKAQLDEAQKQLSENKIKLDDAKAELDSAKSQLDEAKGQLDTAEKVLLFGEDELKKGYESLEERLKKGEISAEAGEILRKTLDSTKEILAKTRAEYESSLKQYNEGLAKYNEGLKQYNEGKVLYEAGLEEYESGRLMYDLSFMQFQQAKMEYEAGLKQYNEGLAQYNTGVAQLEDAKKQYEEGKAEYEKGLKEYNDGKAEFDKAKADAEKELADAEEKINEAREILENLAPPEWYVFDRDDNPGYTEYGQNADRIHNISLVFPIFFVLVAALVCLTTMTRMVDEQRTQIGTLKALGYSNGAIMFKYMLYAAVASIAGALFGTMVGLKLFPAVIITAYGMMYKVPDILMPLDIPTIALTCAAAVALALITVYFSCKAVMSEQPSSLMRPKAPKVGKKILLERIPLFWNRLSFSHKVTIRNIFRYKRRMLMTVIGIAGCTALVLTGFGVYDSVNDILNNQFRDISIYTGMAAHDENISDEAKEEIYDILFDYDCTVDEVYQKQITVKAKGKSADGYIFGAESDDVISLFVNVKDRLNDKKYTVTDDGVVINEKLATLLGGVTKGDNITLELSETKRVKVKITDICENYANHYIYMTAPLYKELTGEELLYNCTFFNSPDMAEFDDKTEEEMANRLMATGNIMAVSFKTAVEGTFSNMLKSLNMVVLVLIVSAGLLAFIVLFNLTNININERIREIATLKVLGFYDKEVSLYVFRETFILTALGTIAGLILGRVLTDFVVKTAEIDMVMFGREVHPLSFVLSIIITLVFAVIVTLVMHKHLKNVDMVEALKSVE